MVLGLETEIVGKFVKLKQNSIQFNFLFATNCQTLYKMYKFL